MRNELNKLVSTVQDPKTQKVSYHPPRQSVTYLNICRLSTKRCKVSSTSSPDTWSRNRGMKSCKLWTNKHRKRHANFSTSVTGTLSNPRRRTRSSLMTSFRLSSTTNTWTSSPFSRLTEVWVHRWVSFNYVTDNEH